MSGMVSRWPVLLTLPVEDVDRDPDGRLSDAAVERLFARARAAYFERCVFVDAAALELRKTKVQLGGAPPGADGVTVAVNVVEVFHDRFTMMARLRPAGPADDDGIAATAWCSMSPGGEVPHAMRDEFIALAHAAAYMH